MEFQVGDRVRISPRCDVYGMMGAFVNQIGTVECVKTICGGQYTVAEINLDNKERTAVVQTKHLEKVKG